MLYNLTLYVGVMMQNPKQTSETGNTTVCELFLVFLMHMYV